MKNISTEELNYTSNIFKQYCSNQLTKTEMLDYFLLPAELKDCVINIIEARKLQICKKLMNIQNSKHNLIMESFDWDIKYILGNSTLASHREQIATLILNCKKNNENETLSMEMDRDMIDVMIKELENCSAVNE